MKRIVPVLLCVATLMAAPAQGVLDAADKQLLEAVSLGRTHEVRLLLDAGANPNIRTEDERTVLFVAVKAGHADVVDVVQLLLDGGLDINAQDGWGITALGYAVSYGPADVVRLLLQHGANVNVRNDAGQTALHNTVLSYSADVDVVQALLDGGADVNAREADGGTALHTAAYVGPADVVRLLLHRGADVDARANNGRTALHNALYSGRADVDVVQALLDVGTDVNARDAEGALPLHWVISDEKSAVVQLFLKGGADVNARDPQGNTPLHLAATRDSREVARLLLNASADVNARDHQGSTPLHLAAANDSREVARLLLNASADVNTRNTTGNTALHWSVLWGRHEIARLLLDAGADMNTPDADFITPLDLVDLAGEEFLRLLGADANVNAWSAEARRSRFELYNSCKPIDISVGLQLSGNEGVQGLTEETIQAALESRLRAARLYDSDASSYYFVRVHLMDDRIGDKHVGWVYGTNVSFNKWVWDEVSGQRRFASTWERSSMGIASSAESVGESILGNVRGYMDQFLAEYLRVNEKTCE